MAEKNHTAKASVRLFDVTVLDLKMEDMDGIEVLSLPKEVTGGRV